MVFDLVSLRDIFVNRFDNSNRAITLSDNQPYTA